MDCPTKMRFAGRLCDDSGHRGAVSSGTEGLVDAVPDTVTEDADRAWRTERMPVPDESATPEHRDNTAMPRTPGAPRTVQFERLRA